MKRRVAFTALHAACVLLTTCPLPAQDVAPQAKGAGEPQVLNDLTTRFRLHEKYMVGDAPRRSPGELSQYRVGFKETFRTSADQAQGAPVRSEATHRAIYDERPARVSTLDARRVTDVVRRYVGVQMVPDTARKLPGAPKPFDDLTIWIHTLPGETPEITVLTPGRQLLDGEYIVAAEEMFMPDLAYALPETPVRVGETWTVSRTGASTLVGLDIRQGSLTGKLLSVRADPAENTRTAILDIQGTVSTNAGDGPIHAELEFVFDAPPAPPEEAKKDPRATALVDAVGWIESVSLAQELTGAAPGADGRLKVTVAREFILERRVKGNDAPPLSVPKEPPAATVDNSWVTYVDPDDRFHLRHPQSIRPQQPRKGEDAVLGRPRAQGVDVISLTLVPRAELAPDAFDKKIRAELEREGFEIIPGQSGWLPEADWPKLKVHRTELATMPKGRNTAGTQRGHEVDYVLQTGREQGLQVRAATTSDPPTTFFQEVESILKTFQFGAPGASAP